MYTPSSRGGLKRSDVIRCQNHNLPFFLSLNNSIKKKKKKGLRAVVLDVKLFDNLKVKLIESTFGVLDSLGDTIVILFYFFCQNTIVI